MAKNKKTQTGWERVMLGTLAGAVAGMSLITVAYRGEDTVPVEVFVEHIETPAVVEIGQPATITNAKVIADKTLARTASKGFSR